MSYITDTWFQTHHFAAFVSVCDHLLYFYLRMSFECPVCMMYLSSTTVLLCAYLSASVLTHALHCMCMLR